MEDALLDTNQYSMSLELRNIYHVQTVLLHARSDCCLQLGPTDTCVQQNRGVFLSPALFRDEIHIVNKQRAVFSIIPIWRYDNAGLSIRSLDAVVTPNADATQLDIDFNGRREWVNGLFFPSTQCIPAKHALFLLGSHASSEANVWHFIDRVDLKNATLLPFGLLNAESFTRIRVVATVPLACPFFLVAVNAIRAHFGDFVFFRNEAVRIQLPNPSIYAYHFAQGACRACSCCLTCSVHSVFRESRDRRHHQYPRSRFRLVFGHR